MKEKLFLLKKEWNTWFLYFLVYCFVGWIYEVLVYWLEFKEGFVNRGFLFGPYLPVYGVGGILILLTLYRRRDRQIYLGNVPVTPLVHFLIMVAITTVVELITSYLMEWGMGHWLWDYSIYHLNFQGRISLNSSLRFGVMGLLGLYVMQPMMERTFHHLRAKNPDAYYWGSVVLTAVFCLDVLARFVLGSNS